jgi:hypothetical protein
MEPPKRLLILACSQRKRPDPGLLPAMERYDGPAFQVLRRFLRERPDTSGQLDIFILSAAYGLIPAEKLIPNYDQLMTFQRAAELQSQVLSSFSELMNNSYVKFCLAMSEKYLAALKGWEALIPLFMSVTVTDGPQGVKLAQLKNWLWGDHPINVKKREKVPKSREIVRLRGKEIRLTPAEVFKQAHVALKEDGINAKSFRGWYVDINGQHVAPKWLVSKLTGLSVSTFTSGEARRMLNKLGIQVSQVHATINETI